MQVKGFSKLPKIDKLKWIVNNMFSDPEGVMKELMSFWHPDENKQRVLDGFSENTISNFILPYGVAPNFLINGKSYVVPMVIEESSVVAAASAGAKFWSSRGGFEALVLSTSKVGHVHFSWTGDPELWGDEVALSALKSMLREETDVLTVNMRKRGGGIERIEFLKTGDKLDNLYQVRAYFQTCDSMGANFINTVLEQFATTLKSFLAKQQDWPEASRSCDIIMSILSNYTPDCVVRAMVSCPISQDKSDNALSPEFATKFYQAIHIAKVDPYRATTHNKGIYNGVDAVVLATGNDFRAIEACGHAYAARSGQYRSLSDCSIDDDQFRFWLDLPLAVGTVGGLTRLHPMAKRSLEMLDNPSAEELMQIIASVGLAQNFMAVRSLITTGIQKGHMKLHLQNILNHLEANEVETKEAMDFFQDKAVSFAAVRHLLETGRGQ